MDVNRREFLKIAGLSTLFGVGVNSVFQLLAPGELEASLSPLKKDRKIQWAIAVDMKKVDDRMLDKAVEACHRYHNVPKIPGPKGLKWIWKEDFEHSFPEQENSYVNEEIEKMHFPLLCNHCDNPPCCRVCPTKATFKREDGIVMMDWHRCIGCRFCMAACPYGSRSFNWGDPRRVMTDEELKKLNPDFPTNMEFPTRTKGVVEKCTFCYDRIDKGKRPICVEVANKIKEQAFIFGNILDPESDIRTVLKERFALRRKPELGTGANIYYLI